MVLVEEVETPIRMVHNGSVNVRTACGTSTSPVSTCTPFQPEGSSRTQSGSPGSHASGISNQSPPNVRAAKENSAAAIGQSANKHEDNLLDTLLQRLEEVSGDIGQLRRGQEQLSRKHEETEVFRRGQIDSVSERVFQAEKKLRKTEEEQTEAIEKANATFQKHFDEVNKDRHNLMSAITQVNQNFERVSVDMCEQRASMATVQQGLGQLQQNIEWLANDVNNKGVSIAAMQQTLSLLDSTLQAQNLQIQELQVSTKVLRDTVIQATPQSSFAEAEERHRRLADNFAEVQNRVAELAVQMAKVDSDLFSVTSPRSNARQDVPVPMLARSDSSHTILQERHLSLQVPSTPSMFDTPPAHRVSNFERTSSPCDASTFISYPSSAAHVQPPPSGGTPARVLVEVESAGVMASPAQDLSTSAAIAAALASQPTASQRGLSASRAACNNDLVSPSIGPNITIESTPQAADVEKLPSTPLAGASPHRGCNIKSAVPPSFFAEMARSEDAGDVGGRVPRVSGAHSAPAPIHGVPFLGSVRMQTSHSRSSTPVPGRLSAVPTSVSGGATCGAPSAPPRRRLSGRHVLSASYGAVSPETAHHACPNSQTSAAGPVAFDRLYVQPNAPQQAQPVIWQGSVQMPHPPPGAFAQPPHTHGVSQAFAPAPVQGANVGIPMMPAQQAGPARARSVSATRTGHHG
jgi:predicted  nucleic acid-binding Zn-ribbon protein